MAQFNPVKEDRDGITAKRMIWSTEAIDMALKGLREGRKLVANPFYENNTKLLKNDLVFDRTPEEIEEFQKCMEDILYFANVYAQLMTPEGIKHIKLRDYQEKYLKHLCNHQLTIYLACRQCSKTTMSALYLLWYILFNTDKNALVVGNKRKTAVEILDKIKKIFLELPYFLKPGILKWNENEVVFDNGCRIMAEATTVNSGISFTYHVVLADEFAHLPKNIQEPFYNNLFPTITAGKSKFMITSTQNGFDLFCRLYKAAVDGENDYAPFKTDWDEVPEWNETTHSWDKRDEEWHQRQVANYGSEEAFNKQFGTNFDVSANTLISTKILRKKQNEAIQFETKDLPGVAAADYYLWLPHYDPIEQLKKDYIIVTIDIAEGAGGDYTIFLFNRLTETGTECVGLFRSNSMGIDKCTESLQDMCLKYLDTNKLLISLETNLYGDLFIRQLFNNRNDNQKYYNFDENVLIRYYGKTHEGDTSNKFTYGLRVTSGNKTMNCKLFKEKYEKGIITNQCELFLMELENFCDNKGNDTFQASFGHDDIVMAQIQLVAAMQGVQYKFLRETFEEDKFIDNTPENLYNPYDVRDLHPFVESSLISTQDMYSAFQKESMSRLQRF